MPLVSCPKCATRLKVPDGAAGNVKCPKCASIFPVAAKPVAPAFEVVEDAPPPPPPRPAPKPAAKPAAPEPEFEIVEEEKPRKKAFAIDVGDINEEDDRPRGKSKGNRRRDEDEDDEDDSNRPRGKNRNKRRRDEDEDDWQPAGRTGAGAAKIAVLMLIISLWLYFGTYAILALYMFIAWVGGYISTGLMVIPGILGLANWVCAAVGLGFSIAGPARSRGLAIAATAVAAVHLILAFVIANNSDAGIFSNRNIQVIGLMAKMSADEDAIEEAQKNPSKAKALQEEAKARAEFMKDHKDELEDMLYYEARLRSKESERSFTRELKAPTAMRWADLSSMLPFADELIAVLSYHNKLFGEYVFGLLGGLLEIARLILIVLLIGSLGRALKGHEAADRAKFALIGVCIAVASAILISLLVAVLVDSAQEDQKNAFKNAPTGQDLMQDPGAAEKAVKKARDKARSAHKMAQHSTAIGGLLNYTLFAGMMVMPVIAAHGVYSVASRRAR